MITFKNLGQYGRLGNQFFQYAALKGLALRNKYEMIVPYFASQSWHEQRCLLTEFNIKEQFIQKSHLNLIKNTYEEANPFVVDKDFFKIPDFTNLSGFFQSCYYFIDFKEEIIKDLTPKNGYLDFAKDYINEIKSKNNNCELVSVHIRRGDNTHNLNEDQKILAQTYDSLNGEPDKNSFYFKYFEKAKEYFRGRNVKYLIFVGGSRSVTGQSLNDLDWCKKAFVGDEFVFSENSDTMNDLCRIMVCDHNIVGPISSFGWWAAFLNKNKNKHVIAPNCYHPDILNYTHREMFYPKDWILL